VEGVVMQKPKEQIQELEVFSVPEPLFLTLRQFLSNDLAKWVGIPENWLEIFSNANKFVLYVEGENRFRTFEESPFEVKVISVHKNEDFDQTIGDWYYWRFRLADGCKLYFVPTEYSEKFAEYNFKD
jgi:hypothetical protein